MFTFQWNAKFGQRHRYREKALQVFIVADLDDDFPTPNNSVNMQESTRNTIDEAN